MRCTPPPEGEGKRLRLCTAAEPRLWGKSHHATSARSRPGGRGEEAVQPGPAVAFARAALYVAQVL